MTVASYGHQTVSAWQAIQQLQGLLGEIPTGLLPAGHCSTARPSAAAQMPAAVVSADDVDELSGGLGGLVGASHPPATGASTASRCSGILGIELWAATPAAMNDLAEATFAALRSTPAGLAETGFSRLTLRSIGPGEQAPVGEGAALRMPIRCAFAHESVTPAPDGGEGLIQTVHVELLDELHEVMDIP